MKNWKKIIFGTAAISVALGGIAIQPAQAGWLSDLDPTNPQGKLREGLRDIDPTNPNSSLGEDLHAKFKICNETENKVHYTVNGESDTLNPNYCVDWTTTGQAVVDFDRGFGNGYQGRTYTLNDGGYYFTRVNWEQAGTGIDLMKR